MFKHGQKSILAKRLRSAATTSALKMPHLNLDVQDSSSAYTTSAPLHALAEKSLSADLAMLVISIIYSAVYRPQTTSIFGFGLNSVLVLG